MGGCPVWVEGVRVQCASSYGRCAGGRVAARLPCGVRGGRKKSLRGGAPAQGWEPFRAGKLASAKKGKKIPLKEPGYATVTRLGKEFYYLTMANESSKLTDLSKESRKKLEKLGEALQELFDVNSLGQSVPSELLKSNTVLSARQSGYLLGDLAAEQLMARKAVNKTFAKWLKTVKY